MLCHRVGLCPYTHNVHLALAGVPHASNRAKSIFSDGSGQPASQPGHAYESCRCVPVAKTGARAWRRFSFYPQSAESCPLRCGQANYSQIYRIRPYLHVADIGKTWRRWRVCRWFSPLFTAGCGYSRGGDKGRVAATSGRPSLAGRADRRRICLPYAYVLCRALFYSLRSFVFFFFATRHSYGPLKHKKWFPLTFAWPLEGRRTESIRANALQT